MDRYPGIAFLEEKARKRIPHVAWQYLQTGTGLGHAVGRNRAKLQQITLTPRFIKGKLSPDLSCELFGKSYQTPFGIAPVGLAGLVWPKAESILARTAKKYNFPYTLSTVATQTPETVGPQMGEMGWFQLYPPKDSKILEDLLKRAADTGFHTLIITADVPAAGRREEAQRAGLRMPPKITPDLIWQGITHPAWTIATLQSGLPSLKTVESYADSENMKEVAEFARFKFRGDLDWDYIERVRELWDGPIIMKGILHPQDALQAVEAGMDGIGVSNHGGRQFDGAPAAIDALEGIAKAVNGKAKVVFDSGIYTGLDIVRALALGADFVLIGKAFMYSCAALGNAGGDHCAEIFIDDLQNNMKQLGVESIEEVKALEAKHEL